MVDSVSIDLNEIQGRTNMARDYPDSYVAIDNARLWMEVVKGRKQLALLARSGAAELALFNGDLEAFTGEYVLQRCPLDEMNARALHRVLPWLQPVPLGLATSAGFGDRLGIATPGHVRALHRAARRAANRPIAPIFAQQSIREMERTGRTHTDVLTDATWGAFQAGWRGGVGADADHLKTTADIDSAVAAGYTLFTIDPGASVDDTADDAPPDAIQRRLEALPWSAMEMSANDLRVRYAGKQIALEDRSITLDGEQLARAAVKYGAAIAHVKALYRHLANKGVPFELEVSVDETETRTTYVQHIYIASELRRLGVRWVSLAPRYPGRFEKGVDFVGNLDELATDLEAHAGIARILGPYKLSLHSGSDKFRIYPVFQAATRGVMHLKTAGTSYLEALRVIARVDPALFRDILMGARERYSADRETYAVSADSRRIRAADSVRDERLPDLLNDPDTRQILHVTFGSSLTLFRPQLLGVLTSYEEAYAEALEAHFVRHLIPFVDHPVESASVVGEA